MTSVHSAAPSAPAGAGEVFLFGIPIGGLGWFATLLMGTAAGFAAFFGGTFLGIVGIMIANGFRHDAIDYAVSYRLIGFPLGVLVLIVALSYLSALRLRRTMRNR